MSETDDDSGTLVAGPLTTPAGSTVPTHRARKGQGGHRSFRTHADMLAFLTAMPQLCEEGMTCRVRRTEPNPALRGSYVLANDAWVPMVAEAEAAMRAGRLMRVGVPYLPYEGTTLVKPRVFVFAGQSNMQGAGVGGSKVIDQRGGGIWFYSDMGGRPGGTMLRAAFGVAPFNKRFIGFESGDTTTTDPTEVTNNQAPHFLNRIRELGIYPDSTPLWGVMNALGGNSIHKWTDQGPASQNFVTIAGALATLQSLWDEQRAAAGLTGVDLLEIEHLCWQQGEGDSTTAAGTANTRDLYIASFRAFHAQWKALPAWTVDTTISLGEAGRWRARYATDGVTLLVPGNSRNDAMRYLGSGAYDPQVTLVSSAGLPNALTDSDASHFSGDGLVELGRRHAAAFMSSRLGTAPHSPVPRTPEGWAAVYQRRINATNETLLLGEDDVTSGFFGRLANADVRLPGIGTGDAGVGGIFHVWSASVANTIIRPPDDRQTLNIDGVSQPIASLAVGYYQVTLLAGVWVIRSWSPKRGDYLPLPFSVPTTGCLGLAGVQAYDATVQSFGGYLGLPAPQQGARISILIRSSTGGDTRIGKAFNSVAVSAAGSGYAVGDTVTLGLNGAAGVGPTIRVRTLTASGGGIATFDTLDYGCLYAASTTGPLPAASTSEAGVGATFTFSITSALFYAASNTGVAMLAYSKPGAVIVLLGMGAGWQVTTDTGQVVVGRPLGVTYEAQAVTITETAAMGGLSAYVRAATITLPMIAAGFSASLQFRVWSLTGGASTLVAPAAGLISTAAGDADTFPMAVVGVYSADWFAGRWHCRFLDYVPEVVPPPDVRPVTVTAELQTVTLTEAQAQYGVSGYLRAAVVNLPTISAGYTASAIWRVWSVTGGTSSLVAPGPGLINAASGNVDSVTLGVGLYRADWAGGRWVVRRLLDADGEPLAELGGSFTPTLECGTPGDLTVTYAVQNGLYLRHGKLISVRITLTATATYTTAAGPWRIAGLPAAAAAVIAPRLRLSHSSALVYGAGRSMVDALVAGGTTRASLRGQGSGQGDSDLAVTSIPSGQPVGLTLTGTYEAA